MNANSVLSDVGANFDISPNKHCLPRRAISSQLPLGGAVREFKMAKEMMDLTYRGMKTILESAVVLNGVPNLPTEAKTAIDNAVLMVLCWLSERIRIDRASYNDDWLTRLTPDASLHNLLPVHNPTELAAFRRLLDQLCQHRNRDLVKVLNSMPQDVGLYFFRMICSRQDMTAAPPPA